MRVRICPGQAGDPCGHQTSHSSGRCDRHNRGFREATRNPAYDHPAWRRLRTAVLRAWRAEHGDWCPGYAPLGHAPHATTDLTVDHTQPLAHGGALLGPTSVMCRSVNTRKRWAQTPTRRAPE